MDGKDYFARAEVANKRYRNTVIVLLLVANGVLITAGASVFQLNSTNHRNSVSQLDTITQNEIKLNENLSDSIKCILLLTPQTYNAQSVNACFAVHNNLIPPKYK